MSNGKKILSIVFEKGYEPAVQYIQALIEKKDDTDDGNEKQIVGVEDGTVTVGVMDEKQYFDNKMTLSSEQKILFIGDVKEKESLELIMETLYDKHGVKIGKSGNQLLITTSVLPLILSDPYKKFIEEFKSLSNIPATKKERKLGWNWNTAKKSLISCIPGVGKLLSWGALTKDAFDDKAIIKKQQMLFAVSKLYYDYLDRFIKA